MSLMAQSFGSVELIKVEFFGETLRGFYIIKKVTKKRCFAFTFVPTLVLVIRVTN